MALQEYYTRTDGFKFVLRESKEGRWSVKCLRPPVAPATAWDVAWECDGTTDYDLPVDGEYVPFNEARARALYEGFMG